MFKRKKEDKKVAAYSLPEGSIHHLEKEAKMATLTEELREHILFMSDYIPFSKDWLQMQDSMNQVSNVAFMEKRMPQAANANPLLQIGKKDKGTLWDQEKDEIAIRVLIEEGKLNVTFRILYKYCTLKRNVKTYKDKIATSSKENNISIQLLMERGDIFEQSVGLLLKYCLEHVEAVQISPVEDIFKHCKNVLVHIRNLYNRRLSSSHNGQREDEWMWPDQVGDDQITGDNSDNGKDADESNAQLMKRRANMNMIPLASDCMQETLVIHYLSSISRLMEDMHEDKIMELMYKLGLVPLFINHMHTFYNWYKVETLCYSAAFLHYVMGSEAYDAEPEKFITGELKKKVVELKTLYIQQLVDDFGLVKFSVYKLMDNIYRWEEDYAFEEETPVDLDD